jgi:DNA-binding IclR family transcriptional regulator
MLHRIAILACFSPEHPTLDLDEIAGTINVSRTDTHEHASALVTLGYLEQEQDAPEEYRLARQPPQTLTLICA